jgi:uncharacterized protein (TIGR02680 family)
MTIHPPSATDPVPTATGPVPVVPDRTLPTRLAAERAGDLPHPRRERWQPLRVGLLDLFHYDHQEFWFRDGRLLWRGNNGTGKSKVLALTLPLLLDGEFSPHRVEPDGDQHKRMEWNLLLGGRYPDRLGYTWIEFGRLDDDGGEHHLTAGIAMKAVAGRGIADRWFFVTDRRVGVDLPLVTASGTALTRDRLLEAIGDRGHVVRTAEHYRRLLDERLFQLGADRYGALLDLLIQLRQPQLSKRPDPVLLSRALSEALTPLDASLLADAAAGFHDLEQQRDELRSLRDTHAHVERFGARYTRYAAVAARRQARELRTAHSAYEDAGRRLGEIRQLAEAAATARQETEDRLVELRRRRRELDAVREQLTEAPELRRLDRARQDAEGARHRAEAAARRLTAAQGHQGRSATHLDTARAAEATARAHRDEAAAVADGVAAEAASGPAHAHALTVPGIADDVAALRRELTQVADDRGAALDQVRHLAREASTAAHRLTERLGRLSGLEADRDAAVDALTVARDAVAEEGERLLRAWREFAASTDSVEVPFPEEVGLPGWTLTLAGPDPASAALDERAHAVRRDLARTEAGVRDRLELVRTRIEELVSRRAELEAGVPSSPPVPPTRDEEFRARCPGAPLWRVVDVREDTTGRPVTDAERAGLEAALEASGLLDAWITPDGRALEAGRLDTVLLPAVCPRPAPGRRTLADLFRATVDPVDPQASALTAETVTAVLAAVEVRTDSAELPTAVDGDPAADGVAVVCLDGGFRLGPLRGRWAKSVAEYLGATAREQARRARLAELAVALDAAEAERAEAREALAATLAAEERLVGQLAGRPSDQSLRDAHARAAGAVVELDRREALLGPARDAVAEARAGADAAQRTLVDTAADLGMPANAADQEQVAAALARYRVACGELVAAVQRHQDRLAEVGTWQVELEAATAACTAAAEEDAGADEDHRAAEARLRTLTETVGDTVAQLRDHLERTLADLAAADAEQVRLDSDRTDAAQRLGEALGRQRELLAEQDGRQRSRDEAVRALRAFAATGLLTVAVADLEVPDPGVEWAADPAVRLARRAEAALGEVDDSDAAWRRVQDDITRRFAELTESLTRYGHQAHADLREGCFVVSIVYTGRERTPAELRDLLATELELRERELTSREQQVLEEHLVGDVASRLQELITEADAQVGWMNAELAERPTSTGMRLRLVWQPDPDGPEGLAEARAHLLRQTSQLWSAADRRAVRDFLQRQIQRMRAEDPQGTWAEHLRRALDYRSWHRFVIERLQDGAWRSAVGPSSGGERVLSVSLPLFAAASAHYRSAHPHAPRLVLLDEAFAGVDDDARAKCLGLLTQFDLDVAMTSEREWGFYATVPGIATYQLVRHDGLDAVHATAWEWDGVQPRQVHRPVLLPQVPGAASGAEHGVETRGRTRGGTDGGTGDPGAVLF